jgi:hypothetical protein
MDGSDAENKITYHRLAIVVLSLIILVCFICEDKRNSILLEQANRLAHYSSEVSLYKDKNGKLITQNNALKINGKLGESAVKGLSDDLERLRLKKAETVIRYVSIFRTDSIYTEFETKLPCSPFNKMIEVDSPYYKYSVVITDSSFYHSPILSFDTAQFIIAEKKDKWWKPAEYSVVFDNKNKDYNVVGLESYTFTPDKKWYQLTGTKVAAGAIGVMLIQQALKMVVNP